MALDHFDQNSITAGSFADVFDFDSQADYDIQTRDGARMLQQDNEVISIWPSGAALIADIAAAEVLSDWDRSEQNCLLSRKPVTGWIACISQGVPARWRGCRI